MQERRWDLATVIGIVAGILCLTVPVVMTGGTLRAYVDIPSIIMTGGGCICAVLIATPLQQFVGAMRVALNALVMRPQDPVEIIKTIVRFGEIARKDGILALEGALEGVKDDFLVRGVQMAVDGSDPELIHQTMLTELEYLQERHTQGKRIFEKLGSYAPAYGLLGTVLGLIQVLANLSEDVSKIGPNMALALVTTLYGATMANFIFLPVADKLAARNESETLLKVIVINGVMSIQSGDNPKIVEQKLKIFLPPGQRRFGRK